ncbi:hypothetical protein, partial [Crocosphaera watsonii]|uniref:hypothetical protein n=1 Tax=Crocosphaera watsonii TaxID=263511 RepID=UPI0030D7B077
LAQRIALHALSIFHNIWFSDENVSLTPHSNHCLMILLMLCGQSTLDISLDSEFGSFSQQTKSYSDFKVLNGLHTYI